MVDFKYSISINKSGVGGNMSYFPPAYHYKFEHQSITFPYVLYHMTKTNTPITLPGGLNSFSKPGVRNTRVHVDRSKLNM